MNSTTIHILDMLDRSHTFLRDDPALLALPRVATAHQDLQTAIATLRAAAHKQTAGSGEAEGGVDLRITTSRELRTYLRFVNQTGRLLDTEHPGIKPHFRLPKTGSYPALLVTARTIRKVAAEYESDFIECGLAPTFLADLTAHIDAFEAATSRKLEGNLAKVAGTAALKVAAGLGMIAARKLDTYVRNHYRTNREKLAAWHHARHIERAPIRKPKSAAATAEHPPAIAEKITPPTPKHPSPPPPAPLDRIQTQGAAFARMPCRAAAIHRNPHSRHSIPPRRIRRKESGS